MAEFYSAAAGQSPPLPWTNLSPPHTQGARLIVDRKTRLAYAQKVLADQGIYLGYIDGITGPKTRQALRTYQGLFDNLTVTGEMDDETFGVLSEDGPLRGIVLDEFAVKFRASRNGSRHSAKKRAARKIALNTEPMVPSNEFDKIAVDGDAYGIERIDCEGNDVGWMLFYKGQVEQLSNDGADLKLQSRYGYRYTADEAEGIVRDDWWCIPRVRVCYSEVDFKKWQGRHQPAQVVHFERTRLFATSTVLAMAAANILKSTCN